jgi:hypothetical protein
MTMERNVSLLLLLVIGIIVIITGFILAQPLLALTIVVLIVATFLYLDIEESHKSGGKALKKNAFIAIFVIVTGYSMFTGLWIFWAGITVILYSEILLDSIKEWWLDARQLASLDAVKAIQSPGTLQQSILHLEERMNALEREKSR